MLFNLWLMQNAAVGILIVPTAFVMLPTGRVNKFKRILSGGVSFGNATRLQCL